MLEDRDVVINLGPMALGDALGNPHNVATFLLLELHKGIENTKVELVPETPTCSVSPADLGRSGVQGLGPKSQAWATNLPFDKQAQHSPRARRIGLRVLSPGLLPHLRKAACTPLTQEEAGAGAWGKRLMSEGAVGCRGWGCRCQQACPRPTVRALTGA